MDLFKHKLWHNPGPTKRPTWAIGISSMTNVGVRWDGGITYVLHTKYSAIDLLNNILEPKVPESWWEVIESMFNGEVVQFVAQRGRHLHHLHWDERWMHQHWTSQQICQHDWCRRNHELWNLAFTWSIHDVECDEKNSLTANRFWLAVSTFWDTSDDGKYERRTKIHGVVNTLMMKSTLLRVCCIMHNFADMIGAVEIMSYGTLHLVIHAWCKMCWEEFLDCQQILNRHGDIQRLWWKVWDELRFLGS